MEARVSRCTHAATSVPSHVTCCDAQTISEASKHQILREWPSSSCYARTSEIYLYGGICKKPQHPLFPSPNARCRNSGSGRLDRPYPGRLLLCADRWHTFLLSRPGGSEGQFFGQVGGALFV